MCRLMPATVMPTMCPGKRTHSTTKHVPQGHNVGPNVSSHACHCYAHHVSRQTWISASRGGFFAKWPDGSPDSRGGFFLRGKRKFFVNIKNALLPRGNRKFCVHTKNALRLRVPLPSPNPTPPSIFPLPPSSLSLARAVSLSLSFLPSLSLEFSTSTPLSSSSLSSLTLSLSPLSSPLFLFRFSSFSPHSKASKPGLKLTETSVCTQKYALLLPTTITQKAIKTGHRSQK